MKKLLYLVPLCLLAVSCNKTSNINTNRPIFVYVGNFNFEKSSNAYIQCEVDNNGIFTDCKNRILAEIKNPTGMTKYTYNGKSYIYINNFGESNVKAGGNTRCLLDSSTGAFTDCQVLKSVAPNSFTWPIGIKINNGYAYIPNYRNVAESPVGNNYTKCKVNFITGTLTECANFVPKDSLHKDVLFTPEDIAIYKTTNRGFISYIVNQQNNSYAKCEIDNTDGRLINCTQKIPVSPGKLNWPRGIAINNGFIYFANSSDNNRPEVNSSYTKCVINPKTGSLFNCKTDILKNSEGNNLLNSPTGIVIKDIAGKKFAYLANERGKNYTRCNVNSVNGVLFNCNSFDFGVNSDKAVTYIEFSN